ncbi:hypothetical protein HMPREF0294_0865 [Corynebacterium glucuronolyticum ATCC 51867]|nr:hypothetical protein HMPREF0294_0865 [Corynebacterium glucuronolyticum ATCC 51867]
MDNSGQSVDNFFLPPAHRVPAVHGFVTFPLFSAILSRPRDNSLTCMFAHVRMTCVTFRKGAGNGSISVW